MKKHLFTSLLSFCFALACTAQNLQQFELQVKSDSTVYISLDRKAVWNAQQAAAAKQATDFAMVVTSDAFGKQLEWYNLSGKDGKTPALVNGTANRIAAISFDEDQFNRCTTRQYLARMTGHITKNSFSHFSGIGNSNGITQHCFIFETENGKRGLLYVSAKGNSELSIRIKQH